PPRKGRVAAQGRRNAGRPPSSLFENRRQGTAALPGGPFRSGCRSHLGWQAEGCQGRGGSGRILLKLQPKAATALERFTADRLGRQITIILGGEVVTMHKIREVIKGGDVQITSCAVGAANYLLEQLQTYQQKK